MALRILLADDHEIMRTGLRVLLESQPDIKIVGEAKDGRQTVQMAKDLQPDVTIMDISMPGMNGIEATRQIIENNPESKVIALSMHSDKRFVTEMLKAGVSGYLLKDGAFDELTSALAVVKKNQMYLSPRIAGTVVQDYKSRLSDSTSKTAFTILTAREREVLQLLAEGKSTKEAAAILHVSVKTIETHRQNIMSKLEIYNLAELVKYAIREGLTQT